MKILNLILSRLKEPSTYAGIAAVFVAMGYGIPQEMSEHIQQIGIGAAGLLSVLLKERAA